jgi:hypothetical protein
MEAEKQKAQTPSGNIGQSQNSSQKKSSETNQPHIDLLLGLAG